MYRRILSALLGATLLTTGLVVAQSGFLDTFDGTPTAPAPYPTVAPLSAWDVTVHNRDNWDDLLMDPMIAQHGPDCAAPPATHPLTGVYTESVFQCANHIMTAIHAGGYGVIYLTPPVVADFSAGPAVIQWDMSTARTSMRDWVDVWISPFGEQLQLPLQDWLPDLNGMPRHSVQFDLSKSQTEGSAFKTFVTRDFVQTEIIGDPWTSYESFLTPSAARRDTFQIVVSRTHLKVGMPAYNFWWLDTDIPDLGWGAGVVQFGHHSYAPEKECPTGQTCTANTWHWDNVSVSPSLPFTVTRAQTARIDQATGGAVQLGAPTQAGDALRFDGLGNTYEYSLDGGASWQAVALQPASRPDPGRTQSYWQPLPSGTQAVVVRAQGGWWGPNWMARDFSVWSQVNVPPSQRTPTPTPSAPTPTFTPVPTVTPGPTATDLPTPTSLPTITPSPVTNPTATATAGPHCGRTDIINGGLVWTPLPPTQCMQ